MRNLMKSLLVVAVAVPAIASAQIANTRHDMANGAGGGGPKAGAGNNQTCIFCHTPHGARVLSAIWTRPATAYVAYAAGNTTVEGTALPSGNVAPETQRCLTCHDGTTQLGDVGNIGGGVAGSINMPVNVVGAAYDVWTAVSGLGDAAGVGANHPVSIPYAGQTWNAIVSGVPAARVTGAVGDYYATQTGAACLGGTGLCTTANVNIVLYGNTANMHIECGSCHEVHNKYATNLYFLRATQATSTICKACHNK